MKKVLVILFSTVVALNASAQKVVLRPAPIYRPHSVYVRPYVRLGYGYNYGYNPWFYGGLAYGYPYYNHPYYNYPSRLDRKIMDIENDYSDRRIC